MINFSIQIVPFACVLPVLTSFFFFDRLLGKSLATLLNFRHLLIIKCFFLFNFFKIEHFCWFCLMLQIAVQGYMYISLLEFFFFEDIFICRQILQDCTYISISKPNAWTLLHSTVRTESCINISQNPRQYYGITLIVCLM